MFCKSFPVSLQKTPQVRFFHFLVKVQRIKALYGKTNKITLLISTHNLDFLRAIDKILNKFFRVPQLRHQYCWKVAIIMASHNLSPPAAEYAKHAPFPPHFNQFFCIFCLFLNIFVWFLQYLPIFSMFFSFYLNAKTDW